MRRDYTHEDGGMRDIKPARPAAPSPRNGRLVYFAMVAWLIWLVYLVAAIASLVAAHPAPLRLIGSLMGAAAFVAVYVWTAWQNARMVVGVARTPATPPTLEIWWPVLAMLALGVVLVGVNGAAWGALFIYTCAGAAGRLATREAAALLAGVALLTLLYAWRAHLPVSAALDDLFTLALAGVTTIAMVWSVMSSRRLREEREQLARFAAVTEERLRIARDLHDLLGHNLSVIALKSELAGRLMQAAPERAAAEIGDIERVARTALQEVREAVAGYRQPTLAGELHGAREVLAAAGIAYRAEGDDAGMGALPAPVDAALAWTVREGVTNVVRHSRARRCEVRLACPAGEASVAVTDDGSRVVPDGAAWPPAGPPVARPGNGLRGLAERVEALGGRFEAGPLPGGGFRLVVAIPVVPGAPPGGVVGAPAGAREPRGPVVTPVRATETSEDGAKP